MIQDLIQVDTVFRGQGIGRMLWEKAVEEARLKGARELYISACPSEETIRFYRAMVAEVADAPIMAIAKDESDIYNDELNREAVRAFDRSRDNKS